MSRFVSLALGAIGVILAAIEPAFAETASAGMEYARVGSAIGIGVAAFGGALGQGKIISAALESIARNPGASGQMFLPWILGVVLVESLVILSFLIAGGMV
jgi:F-type H+-transporting ATPase subunit c